MKLLDELHPHYTFIFGTERASARWTDLYGTWTLTITEMDKAETLMLMLHPHNEGRYYYSQRVYSSLVLDRIALDVTTLVMAEVIALQGVILAQLAGAK